MRGLPQRGIEAVARGAAALPRLAPTYAIAVAAGAVAERIGMPLPWMLGPFFALAPLAIMGFRFRLVPMGRELGQVAIGLAIGLRMTLPVVVVIAALLPEMVLATLYLIAVTTLAAFIFRPLAGVDDVTAFFATAAGGVADMATVAERFGGAPASVAVVHAMRVSCVVAIVPFLVVLFGEAGTAPDVPPLPPGGTLAFLAILVAGFGVARALKPTPIPNPWLVGPIFFGMALAVSGLGGLQVPPLAIVIAQVMLGAWLGCQFRRDLLGALPRVTAAAFVIALFLIACAALGALVLSAGAGLPYTTAFLALAPAAVTEMVLVAKVMHLDAETVTAFHVMRIAVVASTVLLVFGLYTRIRRVRLGP